MTTQPSKLEQLEANAEICWLESSNSLHQLSEADQRIVGKALHATTELLSHLKEQLADSAGQEKNLFKELMAEIDATINESPMFLQEPDLTIKICKWVKDNITRTFADYQRHQALEKLQTLAAETMTVPEGVSVVDELIAERREEAKKE